MSDHSITSLIEKLEGAEVGSRSLDASMWGLLEGGVTQAEVYTEHTEQGPREAIVCELGTRWADDVYPVTTSLDAALALAGRLGHDVFGVMADVIERLERDGWSGFPAPGLQSALARYFCAAVLRAQSEARV